MQKQSEAVRRCGETYTEDRCYLTLLIIRLSAFRPNFFMPKWLLWDEVFLGAWKKLQPKPFARVILGNECCLAQNFVRHLILAKLQCPNVLEQGFAFSREMAFSQRREFCCSWNNLPKFGQDIKAFGEISVCTSSGKSSLDVPQGLFALSMFHTRTSERSWLEADAEHYQIEAPEVRVVVLRVLGSPSSSC